MEEEHLKHFCIVIDLFREHNLRLKLTKCEFFQDETNYLVHQVSKQGVHCNKENLTAVAEFTPPWTYMQIGAFWAWWGTIGNSSRGLHVLHDLLHNHLSWESAHKSEQVMFTVEAKDAFEILKGACLEAPVLAFADFDQPFLLETDATKLGLGLCYHKNRLIVNLICP